MKRGMFERPTDHYDERIKAIDGKLCKLIKERKEISGDNPGYPPIEYISNWAMEFELHEDFLKAVFGTMWNEKQFVSRVEPKEFKGYIPVLKSIERGNRFFSITFIRQYINTSVINLVADWDASMESIEERPRNSVVELFLEQGYNCRMDSGSGSSGHFSYNFVVTPPLPDNVSGMDLLFREYETPFKDRSIYEEFVIKL